MDIFLQKLGINEDQLVSNNYFIKFIRKNENEIIGFIQSENFNGTSFEFINNEKLYINGEEKEIDYFKNLLMILNFNLFERQNLAENGKYLDILINDIDWHVREAVARQGYGLDKLINDKSTDVRFAVAGQGYGLEILVNDNSPWVRYQVARQGYGLDKLINDPHERVRKAAKEKLADKIY